MKDIHTEYIKTSFTIIIGLIAFYLIFNIAYLLYAAIVIGILALSSHLIASYIHHIWMSLAKLMSYIIPNLLMSALFYLILTPIALVQRLVKKKHPFLLSEKSDSTFITVKKTYVRESFEKPW